ncbi:hypothetical protein SeMB42_g02899 [Synchytrium endobioticum]|uniref:Uncharacterized protein n=1 Tax=Synchytrium endobioticum TaxID=286115 RepID=A0A507DCU1_9FUNG|nr:hypothetical protein SeLEV6574_g06128 [Synchytrium endobioticum]TPX48658.1 hypothetical protein SeMB42_g02899 [Synchytrium endobioticum]
MQHSTLSFNVLIVLSIVSAAYAPGIPTRAASYDIPAIERIVEEILEPYPSSPSVSESPASEPHWDIHPATLGRLIQYLELRGRSIDVELLIWIELSRETRQSQPIVPVELVREILRPERTSEPPNMETVNQVLPLIELSTALPDGPFSASELELLAAYHYLVLGLIRRDELILNVFHRGNNGRYDRDLENQVRRRMADLEFLGSQYFELGQSIEDVLGARERPDLRIRIPSPPSGPPLRVPHNSPEDHIAHFGAISEASSGFSPRSRDPSRIQFGPPATSNERSHPPVRE